MKQGLNFLRERWRLLLLVVFLVCYGLCALLFLVAKLQLRFCPRLCLLLLGAVTMLVWARRCKTLMGSTRGPRWEAARFGRVLCTLGAVLAVLVSLGVGLVRTPEHILVKDGMKMLVRVHSFLEIDVDYYEYKNAIFFGRKCGNAWYGSGGNDPFHDGVNDFYEMVPNTWHIYDEEGNLIDREPERETAPVQEPEPEPEPETLDTTVSTGQAGDLAFSATIDGLITLYNKQKYEEALAPIAAWTRQDSPWEDAAWYESKGLVVPERYPTLTVCLPAGERTIRELRLNFDRRLYTEGHFPPQDEITYTLLRIFGLEDREANWMLEDLDALSRQDIRAQGEDSPPQVLYYQGNVGLYAYTEGEISHYCVLPVNEAVLNTYARQGTSLQELGDAYLQNIAFE